MHDNGVTLQEKGVTEIWIYRIRMNWQNEWNNTGHIRHSGYRPAGSKAEFETGEMLKTEMGKNRAV